MGQKQPNHEIMVLYTPQRQVHDSLYCVIYLDKSEMCKIEKADRFAKASCKLTGWHMYLYSPQGHLYRPRIMVFLLVFYSYLMTVLNSTVVMINLHQSIECNMNSVQLLLRICTSFVYDC
jgi:hypothetical protein